jgi:hypothetical protein
MKRNSTPLVMSLAGTAMALACAAILILAVVHGYQTTHAHEATVVSTTHGGLHGNHNGHGLQVPPFDPSSPIAQENALLGTTAWQIDPKANTTFIQGYAGTTTALPGASVALYVSSQAPTTFALDVYRIGWYQGKGGRLYLHQAGLHSLAQGIWVLDGGWTSPCATCTLDSATHLLETHWKVTTHLTIGADWLSGVYLIKLTAANHAESYIPLVVRAPVSANLAAQAPVLANIPFNTYQAYNFWGGYSLYGEDEDENIIYGTRAYKVSFSRPYVRSAGAGDFLAWDIHTVRWMERADLNVTYTADDQLASALAAPTYRVILMLGHGEYWTKAMRDGLDHARDTGISLAFLGADNGYWQARYEPDAAGVANRTLVCYKVSSGYKMTHLRNGLEADTLALDPDYPKHPDLVTALWRDPVLHRPESELLGLEYRAIIMPHSHPDWVVSASALDPLEVGTGLTPGMHIKGGLLGYEFDTLGPANATPAGLHIIADSPVYTDYHSRVDALTAYYRAPSGAIVFDAGTIWWAWGLDESSSPDAFQANTVHGSPPISELTYNIISAMLAASAKGSGH